MGKSKGKGTPYTLSRILLLLLAAAILGIVMLELALFLNHTQLLRGSVVEVLSGIYYRDGMNFYADFEDYMIALVWVIGGGWLYGLIQRRLVRRLFYLDLSRWELWTTIGSVLGFALLFFWETILDSFLLPKMQETDLGRLVFEHVSPWFTFWLAIYLLPLSLVQALSLSRWFKRAWLWPIVHVISASVYGLIVYYDLSANNYELPFLIGPLVVGVTTAVALCLVWIIRAPRQPVIKDGLALRAPESVNPYASFRFAPWP